MAIPEKVKERTYALLRKYLRPYYLRGNIPEPPRIREREFAFYQGDNVSRHHIFVNFKDLKKYLYNNVPTGIHYSTAFYINPAAPMEKKGWKGAELVLEIDTDHIVAPRYLRCPYCGRIWKASEGNTCKSCGRRGSPYTWPSRELLEIAKKETKKLISILQKDFDFRDIYVVFSGHRGFHVHVRDEEVLSLDGRKRNAIVSYLNPINTKLLELCMRGKLNPEMKGMMGRVARIIKKSRKKRGKIKKDICIDAINMVAAHVDAQVATDITHLIRMPGSVHQKTGWITVPVDPGNIDSFDPFTHSVVHARDIHGEKIFETIPTHRIRTYGIPEFEISGKKYGPYEPGIIEVPSDAALFILLKEGGELV